MENFKKLNGEREHSNSKKRLIPWVWKNRGKMLRLLEHSSRLAGDTSWELVRPLRRNHCLVVLVPLRGQNEAAPQKRKGRQKGRE